jgi:hypothetical protein
MNKIKIISLILAIVLIVNFLMLLFVKRYAIWFWVVIVAVGLFAYKLLPGLTKKR